MKMKDPYPSKKKTHIISDILIGIIFTVFLISAGILAAIYFRPLYYVDVGFLGIEQSSGMSKSEIRLNYDALMNYCSPFYKGELSFPTLSSSAEGLSHFKEVKLIFNILHVLALVTLVLSVLSFILKKRHGHYKHLLVIPITAIVLPLVVGITCVIDFDFAFTFMHKVFFTNDDWLFNPYTDPVINILPDTYFLHCALLVILVVFIGSLTTFILYMRSNRRNRIDTLTPMRKNYFY